MEAKPDDMTVGDILQLHAKQMLVVNPEYQRGVVWSAIQKKKLVDSVLRGYPIPLIYLHRIEQSAHNLVSQRYEVIDGQQRINALSEFYEGAFKLLDPIEDAADARFPDFVKKQLCPWGRKYFSQLDEAAKKRFLETTLTTVQITTSNSNEARDLFVRLQAGMPLNSQEKRDAWPGQFTDFVLKLGGKLGIARYPGHDFFNNLMRANRSKDRGKFRQHAAQIAMLYFARKSPNSPGFCDTNAVAIDDFYYENLDFESDSPQARRLLEVLEKLNRLLGDGKRPKIIGHEAIHLVLLVDALMDDYTRSWEQNFADAFDRFREEFARAKKSRHGANPPEYWVRYGVWTRVNSDRKEALERRHEFFSERMLSFLRPQPKDKQRLFGSIERELIYYRDNKKCAKCNGDVIWAEAEIHHIDQHSQGGRTSLENGVLVHPECHPKGTAAAAFAEEWRRRIKASRQHEGDVN